MTDMGGKTQQATPVEASLGRQSNDASLFELSGAGSAADNHYQESNRNGETVAVPLPGAAEPGAGAVVCSDYPFVVQTSEWHRTEEMLRLLAVLQERDRLARAIHDTVERSLLGIMIRLEGAMETMGNAPPITRTEIESARALTLQALEQTHQSVWNLRPPAITDGSLTHAIHGVATSLGLEGIQMSWEVEGVEPDAMDQRNKLSVLRIAQEALSNIRRHAKAKAATVRLSFGTSDLLLRISDDGVGFEPSTPHGVLSPMSGRFGLAGMRESARLAGGFIVVGSSPGAGTQVEARIPFEPSASQNLPLGGGPEPDGFRLTERQLDVLQALAEGGRNKDIAVQLSVTIHTVKFHIENLFRKLEVRTRAELVRVANQRGLLKF